MMQRTQVTLAPEEHRNARRRANGLGISLAEYIRRLVRHDLERPAPAIDPSALFALGDSGGSDVGAHKDEYLGEAIAVRERGS